MNISVRWLNQYLSPADLTSETASDVLTNAGFPIEEAVELENGDVMLDVEVTSNRGDMLAHIGAARDIVAATGRTLRIPDISSPTATVDDLEGITLDNQVKDVCPMFTLRVIRDVKVGPSPDWLVEALESVGQRSINNVVDVTNYVMMEFGQPSHVFDIQALQNNADQELQIVVRYANKGEKLKLLDRDCPELTLKGDELVVADGSGAISLAGVMGGLETEVSVHTTDVLLEAATWDPVTVRTAARRYNLRTDASHRFERIVDPRTIELASRRLADLIVDVAGGTIVDGVIMDGQPFKEAEVVALRPARCCALLGVDVSIDEMTRILEGLDIKVAADGESLSCTIPPYRPDLRREVDLIEEISRIHGIDALPVHDYVNVPIPAPQMSERAMAQLGSVMTGLGFYEAITFTFVSHAAAKPFLPPDLKVLEVSDDRRKAEPVLRPSVIPCLLHSRKSNQDGQVSADGGVRLYEVAPIFAGDANGNELERRMLAMIADVPQGGKAFDRKQAGLRLMRGVVGTLFQHLRGVGDTTGLSVEVVDLPMSAYEPGASGMVLLNGERVGVIGLLSSKLLASYDLRDPVVACELDLDTLTSSFPPRATVHALPEYPGIERDVSLVVSEDVPWAKVEHVVASTPMELLDGYEFVGTFRGKPIDVGRKSVTIRLSFRDATRTLRHEEVDPQVDAFVGAAKQTLNAELRV